MTKTDSDATNITQKKWTTDTTDFFNLRHLQIRAVLITLISNLGEFEKGDGRASDEAVVLATQQAFSATAELEKLSYEFDNGTNIGLGGLSLQLMRARAMLEIIDGMFHANSWTINLGDHILINYLAEVRQLIERADEEVKNIHSQNLQKAA